MHPITMQKRFIFLLHFYHLPWWSHQKYLISSLLFLWEHLLNENSKTIKSINFRLFLFWIYHITFYPFYPYVQPLFAITRFEHFFNKAIFLNLLHSFYIHLGNFLILTLSYLIPFTRLGTHLFILSISLFFVIILHFILFLMSFPSLI